MRTILHPEKWRQRLQYGGWGILGVLNLLFIPLVANYSFPETMSEQLLVIIFFLLTFLLWGSGVVGIGFIIFGYLNAFKEIKLLALLVAMYGFCVYMGPSLNLLDGTWGGLKNIFILFFYVWASILPFGLGLAICVYLFYRDQSVQLVAITALVYVWGPLLYTRGQDLVGFVTVMISGPIGELWWFHMTTCFSLWLLVLGPLSFLKHGLSLLYQEWSKQDMLDSSEG